MASRTTGNKSLQAEYRAHSYTVSFDKNDSLVTGNAPTPLSCTYDTPAYAPACSFSKTGYTFKYWTVNAADGGSGFAVGDPLGNLTSTDNGSVVLYAQWRPNSYTIAFDSNDGSGNAGASDIAAIYDQDYNAPSPSYMSPGCDFSHWTANADGSGASYEPGDPLSNLATADGALATLYAQWIYSPVATGMATPEGMLGCFLACVLGLVLLEAVVGRVGSGRTRHRHRRR